MPLSQIFFIVLIAVFAALIFIAVVLVILKKFNQSLDNLDKPAEPYAYANKANIIIAKENLCTLSWYLLYFITMTIALVYFFGKIEYGENKPYILFLILIGIPFLIAFVHVISNVEDQSARLLASGFSVGQATAHRMKWLFIVPVLMVFVIDLTLQFANSTLR